MSKLRISIVEYLNTAPLVWGFTEGSLAGKYNLSFTVPSQCAESLRVGDVDVAIIPAIEYQRINGLVALPGMAIAAKGEVRSILVVSKKPIDMVKRLALDTSSRSSAALVRLLAAEEWGIQPEFINAAPDPSAMLSEADAALVIGDPALRIAVKLDYLAEKKPREGACCQGDPEDMPVPGYPTLFVYDVAYQWRQMTGKPCVLAIWAGHRDRLTPEVVADFQASKQFGLAHIEDIAEAASVKLDLPSKSLETYLRDNIDFSLDEPNLEGLRLYYEKCAAAGLIPGARPLEFASGSTVLPAQSTARQGA
ncbi:MAG TPA: menaquinone biosynthesis protein [Candidatus Acidoferrales bacterium]|nr:menaquinone biosynthesis protein [Candidatus Acidoferrales bacterium]